MSPNGRMEIDIHLEFPGGGQEPSPGWFFFYIACYLSSTDSPPPALPEPTEAAGETSSGSSEELQPLSRTRDTPHLIRHFEQSYIMVEVCLEAI